MGQFKIDSQNYKEIQNLLQGLHVSFIKNIFLKILWYNEYFQVSFRDRNSKAESKIEINPFLKMLESKIVFVKCNPFSLEGRVFIFGKYLFVYS